MKTLPVLREFNRKKAEIREKFGDNYCGDFEDQEVSLNGIAEGAFTKPGTQQKAYLYTLCSHGSSHFGVGGIIIFENDKVVVHYSYGESGLDDYLATVTDINKNGTDELALINLQGHQGYYEGFVSLVEFTEEKLNFIGKTETYSDNSGVGEENDAYYTAYDIFATPGKNPVFYRDTYEKQGTKKNWSLVKRQEKFSLKKLDRELLKGYWKLSD